MGGWTDRQQPPPHIPPFREVRDVSEGLLPPLEGAPGQLTSILTFHEVILGGSGRGCGAKEWRDSGSGQVDLFSLFLSCRSQSKRRAGAGDGPRPPSSFPEPLVL